MPGDAQEKERAKADVRDLSRAIGHLREAWRDLKRAGEYPTFKSSTVILRTPPEIELLLSRLTAERGRIAEYYQIAPEEYEPFEEEEPDDGR